MQTDEERVITAFNTTQSVGDIREAIVSLGDAFRIRLLTHLGLGVRHVAVCHPVGRESEILGAAHELQGRVTESLSACPGLCRQEGSAAETAQEEESLYP
jgi:hypothetical protein